MIIRNENNDPYKLLNDKIAFYENALIQNKDYIQLLETENKELKELLKEAESISKNEDYYNRLSKYIKD